MESAQAKKGWKFFVSGVSFEKHTDFYADANRFLLSPVHNPDGASIHMFIHILKPASEKALLQRWKQLPGKECSHGLFNGEFWGVNGG